MQFTLLTTTFRHDSVFNDSATSTCGIPQTQHHTVLSLASSQPKDFHLGTPSILTPCSQDCTGAYLSPKVSIVRLIFRHWDIYSVVKVQLGERGSLGPVPQHKGGEMKNGSSHLISSHIAQNRVREGSFSPFEAILRSSLYRFTI